MHTNIIQWVLAVASVLLWTTVARALPAPLTLASVDGDFPYKAVAVLAPTVNNTASGTLAFAQSADFQTTYIEIVLKDLAPNTVHGIHFHAFGDVSDNRTGLTLSGHFNPTGSAHGCPDSASSLSLSSFHVGDIGNITSDAGGTASVTIFRPSIGQSATLQTDSMSQIVGRGVVLHNGADDCVTQPAGNSGSRIAIGVLGWKNGTTFPSWYTASSSNSAGKKAISVVAPLGRSTVKGLAIFTQDGPSSPVKIKAAFIGLAPGSKHGIHVHKFGDITDGLTGLTTGGHFNPDDKPHACPRQKEGTIKINFGDVLHAGDLGNIQADDRGWATLKVHTALLSLYSSESHGILGRALVVHSNNDDCETQPTGASGGRVAAGVIGVRNETATAAVLLTGAADREARLFKF